MSSALVADAPARRSMLPVPGWRDLVWPKEHGSWSLAFEPVALGLLAAPSWGGAALALAVAAGFMARRPLRIAFLDSDAVRRSRARQALAGCAAVAGLALAAVAATAGWGWAVWLVPSVLLGGVFVAFDLRQGGREPLAEIAGSVAFASLPAAFAALAGWGGASAAALAAAMVVRALPTVLVVRAAVRARKGGGRRPGIPLLAVTLGVVGAAWLAYAGLAPWIAVLLAGVLAVRAFVLLGGLVPVPRASVIGMIEAGAGVAYVAGAGLCWAL